MKVPMRRNFSSAPVILSPPPSPPLAMQPTSSAASPGSDSGVSSPGESLDNRVKRPMNPFMVWAQQERPRLSAIHPGIHNAELSRLLGQNWNKMDDSEKKPYKAEAIRIAELHRLQHPDYKYKPRKKDPAARRVRGRRIKQEEISRVFKLLSQQEITQYVGLAEKKRKTKTPKRSRKGESAVDAVVKKEQESPAAVPATVISQELQDRSIHSASAQIRNHRVLTRPTTTCLELDPSTAAGHQQLTAPATLHCHPCPRSGISPPSACNTPPMTPHHVKVELPSAVGATHTQGGQQCQRLSPYSLADCETKSDLFSLKTLNQQAAHTSSELLADLSTSVEHVQVLDSGRSGATSFSPLQFERASDVSSVGYDSDATSTSTPSMTSTSLLSPLEKSWLDELCKSCDASPTWQATPSAASDQFFASLGQLDSTSFAGMDDYWPSVTDSSFLF
eukprot:scpid72796/ scgid22677/ Transcription factor SOX-7